MHRDRRLVVEGHPPLPVGVIFVPLQVQDWCQFGLVRSAEGLLQETPGGLRLGDVARAWLAVWRPWWGRR